MSAEAPVIEPINPRLPDEVSEGVLLMNGQANPKLGAEVAELLGVDLAPVIYRRFKDSSQYTKLKESSRKKTIIAFQSHAVAGGRPETDAFYQHLHMIEAASGAGVEEIIAVAPKFMGDRQDKRVTPREANSAKLNQKLIRAAGADLLAVMDMHNSVNLEVFEALGGRTEHYTAKRMLADYYAGMIGDNHADYVMLPPDEGRHKDGRKAATYLGIALGGLDLVKNRPADEETVTHEGEVTGVEGKQALILDDVLSTASTLISTAVKAEQAGTDGIVAAVIHAQFAEDAAERLAKSPIDLIVVTNTYPIRKKVIKILGSKLLVLSAAEPIAIGLNGTITGSSNSESYGELNY